jgi:uncharacterized protein YggE
MEPKMSTQTTTITLPIAVNRARWLAVGLAGGLVVAAIASPAFGPRQILAADPASPAEHTVSVAGTGRVILSPDTADLRLGVLATAKTVKEARATAASAMTAVLASLQKLGIADRDIQTTVLSLQPVYDYPSTGKAPILTGYNLSNTVAVTIRDLAKLADAIDGALASGATSLDSVSFRVDDQTAAEKQARESAMADAKAKASTLAAAAGVSITGIQSISETVAPIPYPIYYGYAEAGAARDVQTPVMPGTSEVSVSVSVVFVIS